MGGVRFVLTFAMLLLLLPSSAALAAEALKFGPPPDWVVARPIPQVKPTDAAAAILLSDEQIAFESDKMIVYGLTAVRIQNSQGLAAGNLSLAWQPSTQTVTVNKLHILRGEKVIDVLAAGQTFTVVRREQNLEAAMLNGSLTANIQPEGLQVGDIIVLANTVEISDPVMKGHREIAFADWNGIPIQLAHSRVSWPSAKPLNVRSSPTLPQMKREDSAGRQVYEITARDVEPIIAPKSAPARFRVGRIAEATDFASWSDVADLMRPYYDSASVLPSGGSLRDEVERIRASTSHPKARAASALSLVQDRIRYVALVMGQGGYVPASAETTWSRRFGDCKAKTALLLGLLQALGIEAEPVLVRSSLGDAVGDRLPMISVFDHVLVRARIQGKDYWLDGTRSGDTSLDRIEVPNVGWVLPLVRNARLVRLVPPPLAEPTMELNAEIDASAGVYAPAPITIGVLLRGDNAVASQLALANLTEAQRQEFYKAYLKKDFDFVTVKSGSYAYDKEKQEFRLSIKGDAKLEWDDGWFYVPTSSIAFDPDLERAAGPLHDVPYAIAYPRFERAHVRIRLPAGFASPQQERKLPVAVRETVAGVEYARSVTLRDGVMTMDASERSVAPEIPYADMRAAEARLKALNDEVVYVGVPAHYRLTEADIKAKLADKPASAEAFVDRGVLLMDYNRYDEAIADFSQAISADPKNPWPLANRGLAYAWKSEFAAAEKDLAAALALDPDNAVAVRGQGLLHEQKGECSEAIEAYSKALKAEPASSFAVGRRAICYGKLGKREEALADSEVALKAQPSWSELRLMRANILLRSGKKDLVEREAKLLIADSPESAYAFIAAGKIYARLGMKTEADSAFERALALDPDPYVLINRAQARPLADRTGRLADFDAALKLQPDNPEALAGKAEELAIANDFTGAIALYDRALVAQPKSGDFKFRRAILLYKTGRKAAAEAEFAAQHAKAESASDFNNLCWNKAIANVQLEKALDECREALKRSPESGPYLDSLGMVLLRLGRLDEALVAYDRAVAKNTGAASLMGRAFVHARKGNVANAQQDRAKAVERSPEIEAAFAEYGLRW